MPHYIQLINNKSNNNNKNKINGNVEEYSTIPLNKGSIKSTTKSNININQSNLNINDKYSFKLEAKNSEEIVLNIHNDLERAKYKEKKYINNSNIIIKNQNEEYDLNIFKFNILMCSIIFFIYYNLKLGSYYKK